MAKLTFRNLRGKAVKNESTDRVGDMTLEVGDITVGDSFRMF